VKQCEAARRVAAKGLSVRETERLVQSLLAPHAGADASPRKVSRDVQRLEEELSEALGTKVEVRSGTGGKGRVVLHYMSHEHLDDLLARLRG
jgi:ParB family chromosome partitioning protein